MDRIATGGGIRRCLAAGIVGVAFQLLGASVAEARTETLRWTHPDSDSVAAFRIYTRSPGGSFGAPVYDGKPGRTAGIYSQSIDVPDDAIVVVAISAVGDADLESELSNQRTRQPAPADDDFDGDFPEPDPNGALYRLNAGGPSYVDGSGRTWSPDQAYVGAGNREFTTGSLAIAGTTDDILYQTHRFQFDESRPMRYELPVPNGEYLVRLYFAEVYDGAAAAGVRIFDVSVETDIAVDDLDVYAEVGAAGAHVESVVAGVTDGSLTLDLVYDATWPPMLMALEVFEIDGFGADSGTKVDGTANLEGIERIKIEDAGKLVDTSQLTISMGEGVFMALDGEGRSLMGTVAIRGASGRDSRKADLTFDDASLAILKGVIEQQAAGLGKLVTLMPDPEVRVKVNRARDRMKLLATFRVTSGNEVGRYKLELKGPFAAN